MARIRTIKPEFFHHEGMAEFPPLLRLFFIGLWTLADCDGLLEDRPRRIKAALFPWDDVDVVAMLSALAARGFILRFDAAGTPAIWIPGFRKHQRPHPKETKSGLSEPTESQKRPLAALGPSPKDVLAGYNSESFPSSPAGKEILDNGKEILDPSASLRESGPLFDLSRHEEAKPPGKSDTRPPATEQAVKVRKATNADPRHTRLVQRLCDAYERATGRRYGFDGGRHAKAVSRLCAMCPDDAEIEAVWLVAIKRAPAWPGTCDLGQLPDRFNDCASFLKSQSPPSARSSQPVGEVPNEL